MKIKTRESLKTIKTFDRADTLAQKSQSGISSLFNSAEQTQNSDHESEIDYAGSELQGKSGYIVSTAVVGADCVGRWGLRKTRDNIHKLRKKLSSSKRKKTAFMVGKSFMQATVNIIKGITKAVIAATKASITAIKGAIAAIAAGGWMAMVVILIVVLVGLVVGSVYAIFIPVEDSEITIGSVKADLEREYHQERSELIANCQYDILNCEGSLAGWREIIAVYAVKLNLGDKPQEVATFDEDKAEMLKAVFWDMNNITLRTEVKTTAVPRYETDEEGNLIETEEEVITIYLTIVTEHRSIDEITEVYGFSAQQKMMLDELLSEENAELWDTALNE